MHWDFPQETIDPYITDDNMDNIPEDLLTKLESESLSDEELMRYSKLVWHLDEQHPTFFTGLCKKLIITLSRDRLKARS